MRKKTQKKILESLRTIAQHLNLLRLEAQKINTSLGIIADHLGATPQPPPQQTPPQQQEP
jgi:hypothetical protein